MGNDPIALPLNANLLGWNPFRVRPSQRQVMGDLLNLGGVAAAELKLERARDKISLSTTGQIFDKTVVSEVTTVRITANTAYKVEAESKDQATRDKAAGTTIAATPGANGDINVVTADDSQPSNNTGSLSVESIVTYSDGSTETSESQLRGRLASGDGLARKRLDAIVGGSLSESDIMKKLGIAGSDGAAAAAVKTPDGIDINATVSADVSATLTYVQRG